ncbi:hypothetical protein [Hydrogenophaga electricum]|uniref:Uncharacterized protein n=1 Tax=Hydrogenophaga electricum TaxID=1230953 RepID=A0ABQ6C7E9_9BURK|nr:hypothetical protein [Hydrogenophaga electricum]GLS14241.1 hypothetical protein GCM10007935_16720 [Hydrogenophaga electricum]
MYLVVIGWLYVVLMMAVAEASNTTGSVLGAIVTFFLYGLLPLGLVVYLMNTPHRKRAIRAREAAEEQARQAASAMPEAGGPEAHEARSGQPDAGGHAAGAAEPGSVTPVREEPRSL